MSLRTLEAEILKEARAALNNGKLRQKDILEWSTGDITAEEGEIVVKLPGLCNVCVASAMDKRKP